MGLYHTTRLAYGFEIPNTDWDTLDEVLAAQPDRDRVEQYSLGDFEKTFLLVESSRVEENDFARITPDAFKRYEIPAWNTALHNIAVRLGHELHPEPAWLVLHDYS